MVTTNPVVDDQKLDAILEKIQAMLNFNQRNASLGEVENAAAMVSKLLLRYNLTMEQVSAKRGTKRRATVGDERFKLAKAEHWARQLIGVVAKATFCRSIWHRSSYEVTLFGEPHNLEVVKHLYTYLEREILRLCDLDYDRWRPTVPWQVESGHSRKNSFRLGALDAIRRRLEAEHERAKQGDRAVNALVVRNDHELEAAVAQMFPRLTRTKIKFTGSGYEAGYEAGGRIAIRKAIGG